MGRLPSQTEPSGLRLLGGEGPLASSADPKTPSWVDLLGGAVLVGIAAVMAAWTWRTWPDVLIDFGREVYVAWRLSQGEVLHRDVVSVSGPLSAWTNAMLFRVFGVGLDTVFVANAVVAAAILALLVSLLRAASDAFAGWLAGVLFLLLFAFAQYSAIGNYNYIAPYSHELTHGLLFSLAAIACLYRFALQRRAAWLALAGAALGLVSLTKIEVFTSALLSCAVGIGALWLRGAARPAMRRIPVFVGAALLPPLLAVLGFARLADGVGIGDAGRAVTIGWHRLFEADLAGLPFYQRGLGTDEPVANLLAALAWLVALALLFAPATGFAFVWKSEKRVWQAGAFALAVAAALLVARDSIPWIEAARPLPLLMAAGFAACAFRVLREDPSPVVLPRRVLQLMLLAFAGVLLAKMALNARINHYGFVLAMPASLLAAVALVAWIPRALTGRGARGDLFRGAALGALAVLVVSHLQFMAPFIGYKSASLATGPDRIHAHPGFANTMNRALAVIEERVPPGGSVAVFPEGVMLNYLARRPTPTPHFSFNPFELHVYGESEIQRALEESPPDLIVLVHQDTSEHGPRFFTRDYGTHLWAWIRARYRPTQQIGQRPLQPDTSFGIRILEPSVATKGTPAPGG